MSGRYRFNLTSDDHTRKLPEKIIIGRKPDETGAEVLLKAFGYVLFYRERLEIEVNLRRESLQYIPDLVQLDYTMQPIFWGECGEVTVEKLNRLAVKVPEAQIWVIRKSKEEAEQLQAQMQKQKLRTGRYHIIGLESEMFEELHSSLQMRNELYWLSADFVRPNLQFEFNQIWYDTGFTYLQV